MSKRADLINRIIAVVIILFLCVVFAQRTLRHHMGFINSIRNSISNFIQSDEGFSGRMYDFYMDLHKGVKGNVEWNYSYPPRENDFNQLHYEYLRATGRGYFNGVALLTDGRVVMHTLEPELFFNERTDSITTFANYFKNKDIPFLYVRLPNKVQDNSVMAIPFADSRVIENGDMLTEMVSNNGVDTFDVRAAMNRDNINFEAGFYRYHLHWTNNTVLWASQRLGEIMNRDYGFNIDLSVWDLERYNQLVYRNVLYGSEAYHVGRFHRLEDVTFLIPDFPVNLEKADNNHGFQAEFSYDFMEIFLPDIYHGLNERFVCHNIRLPGAHFTYITNHAASEDKRVLMLSDSFSLSWVMYLPLGFKNLEFVYLINQRTLHEIWDFIDGKEYDLVILAVSDVIVSGDTAKEFADDRINFGTPPVR